jgi:hypothetical protein
MSTVKIRFTNIDARPKEVSFDISKDGVKDVMAWYGGYHSGDRYSVHIDGAKVKKDLNGELVGELA